MTGCGSAPRAAPVYGPQLRAVVPAPAQPVHHRDGLSGREAGSTFPREQATRPKKAESDKNQTDDLVKSVNLIAPQTPGPCNEETVDNKIAPERGTDEDG